MSSNPPPILENTPPPLPPPRRRSTAIDETRGRVHGIHHSPSEISALRDMIEKRLSDSEQQRMDALFSAFVDTLREAQVAGMSESEVLKTLDSPVRFTGSQFIDWVVQFKAASAIKSGEVGARSETSGTPAASSVSRDRDLHEAHLLMLVDSGSIQATYKKTPPSLDSPDAVFEIEGTFNSPLHRSSLPTPRPWQVIITPSGDISYGVPGTPLNILLAAFSKEYFERFPGRTTFKAQELASWLLEKRTEVGDSVRVVTSTDQALAIGKRMVLHELIAPCQSNNVFPAVCGVSNGFHGNLLKLSKCFKYDDSRYFVNPVALYGQELSGESKIPHDSATARSGLIDAKACGGGRSRSYSIIIRTGKQAGAGTSGPVYITLFSHLGCTSEQQLQSTFSNALDRAEEHVFTVVASQDIGKPTHVTVRLSSSADPWHLHSVIVCDESFSDNSVFIYKDWLKPTYLCVTLGSQGSYSRTGALIRNSVLSQESSFELTVTKLENLEIPEGFSKLLLKFADHEVGYINLHQYQAPFTEITILPVVECNLSLPSCLISANHQHDDDDDEQKQRIELFACKRVPGNPQLQTQFVSLSEFSKHMISVTGMPKGSVILQLKGVDQSSHVLNPSTISLAFQEKQDVGSSPHWPRPTCAPWMMPVEYVVLTIPGVQVTCGHMVIVWSNLIITNFRARIELLYEMNAQGTLQAVALAPLNMDIPLAFVRLITCQSLEGLHRVKLKTFDETLRMELILSHAVGEHVLKQWGPSMSRHIVNLHLLGSRPPWKFVGENANFYRAAGGEFPAHLSSQESEFQRFGIIGTQSYWRETRANSSSLQRDCGSKVICSSYPSVLAVPSSVTDQVVKGAAQFRSSGRFPCLSWGPPVGQMTRSSYGFICRSSQPNVGVFDNTSPDDERIIKAMTDVKGRLIIFDCRPEINATANKAKGKGSVKSILSNYPGVLLEFLDIENIHCVREAHTKLAKACATMKSEVGDFDDKNFWSSVADSKWLNYLSDIICGSLKVVRNVASGTGALVHCSDGWDRTPQITSLSSVILDPYYRTALGFFILIEKEWCNMGHKFADRLNNSIKTDQEESPVFLQWLDCIWQLWRQCPPAFQFNEVMLLHLADQVYSGSWLHFTHNCQIDLERELELARLSQGRVASPPSFASAFFDQPPDFRGTVQDISRLELKQKFCNPNYAPQLCDGVLFVSGQQRSLQIWPYHFRWISGSLRSHLHPDVVTAELPSPSFLMNIATASVTQTDALSIVDQMLPGLSASLGPDAASELMLGDDWIKETSSNGSFFWRHKVTDDIKWDPSSLTESSSLSATVVPWQDDSESDCCSICLRKFTQFLNRRHHCRLCGRLVCKSCSSKKINEQRACNQCHNQQLRSQTVKDR